MRLIFGLLALIATSTPAMALDRIDLSIGGISRPVTSTPVINSFRAGLSWNTDYFANETDGHIRSLRFESGIGLNRTNYGDVKDVMAAPVLHYQFKNTALPLFAEASVGVTYLSQQRWNTYHYLGSQILFADRVGIGYSFEQMEVSANFYHVSNANLAKVNPGADMLLMRFSFKL